MGETWGASKDSSYWPFLRSSDGDLTDFGLIGHGLLETERTTPGRRLGEARILSQASHARVGAGETGWLALEEFLHVFAPNLPKAWKESFDYDATEGRTGIACTSRVTVSLSM